MLKTANEPARERIYNYVREQILRGNLRGGSFVEEEQISSIMGTSRTPVREAFQKLEAERYIELLPRRGALIRQVTADELVQLYETRRLLEAHSTAIICRRRLPLLPDVKAALEEMEASDSSVDHYLHAERERRFHGAIVASAGNVVTTELYDSLAGRQQRVAIAARGANPELHPKFIAEHRLIYDGLVAFDIDVVLETLEEHLRPIVEVMSKLR